MTDFEEVAKARAEAMDWLHGKDRASGLDGRFAGPLGLVRALIAEADKRISSAPTAAGVDVHLSGERTAALAVARCEACTHPISMHATTGGEHFGCVDSGSECSCPLSWAEALAPLVADWLHAAWRAGNSAGLDGVERSIKLAVRTERERVQRDVRAVDQRLLNLRDYSTNPSTALAFEQASSIVRSELVDTEAPPPAAPKSQAEGGRRLSFGERYGLNEPEDES